MARYKNFYETSREANLRLQHTCILYDGDPYYVLCVTDHKPDGIFRIYMEPVGTGIVSITNRDGYIPHNEQEYEEPSATPGTPGMIYRSRGEKMDAWMAANPNSGVIRKMMNSPAFNKFRPFDLGMMNTPTGAVYVTRNPVRMTQQGLVQNMMSSRIVSLDSLPRASRTTISFTQPFFKDCIKNVYPSLEAAFEAAKESGKSNAFHRHFAVAAGPVSSTFLAYKEDVIGILPTKDSVILGNEFKHCKEIVERLNVFSTVN